MERTEQMTSWKLAQRFDQFYKYKYELSYFYPHQVIFVNQMCFMISLKVIELVIEEKKGHIYLSS